MEAAPTGEGVTTMTQDQTLTQHLLRVIEECADGASQPPEAGPRAGQWTEWDRGVLDGVRMLGVCIQATLRKHAAPPATPAAGAAAQYRAAAIEREPGPADEQRRTKAPHAAGWRDGERREDCS